MSLRCFAFQSGDGAHHVGVYDNGGGDQIVTLLGADWAVLLGFDHESSISPYGNDDMSLAPGMYEGMPDALRARALAYFEGRDPMVTFCLWRRQSDEGWHRGVAYDDDGSDWLLDMLPISLDALLASGADYYEDEFDEEAVRTIYARHT